MCVSVRPKSLQLLAQPKQHNRMLVRPAHARRLRALGEDE